MSKHLPTPPRDRAPGSAMSAISTIEDVERLERAAGGGLLPCTSTYELLCQAAARHPTASLTFDLAEDADAAKSTLPHSWSYAEFVRHVTQAGNLFRRLGVGRRDVVSLLVEEPDAMQAALWGAQMIGVAHPIDTSFSTRLAVKFMAAARSKVLVVSARLATEELLAAVREQVATLQGRVLVVDAAAGASSPGASFRELLAREAVLPLDAIEVPTPDDVCAILQTAGSCGSPKLARLTHGNLVYAATALAAVAPLDASSVMLCGMPASHVSGLVLNGLLPLQVGANLVLLGGGLRKANVRARIWRLAARHRATTLFATPAVLTRLVEVDVGTADLRQLRHVFCGGAGIATGLVHRIEAMTGANVVVGYGLTEASCVSTVVPAGTTAPARSVGLRLPFQALRCAMCDPTTGHWVEVAHGKTGRIQVRGPNVFAGYVGGPVGEKATLPGGWLDTGDLGAIDDHGHLQLVGRDRDVILRAGCKLSSAAIEQALGGHPDVAAVAVIARPDPAEGELPVAYLTLHDGATVTPETLLAHCRVALRDAQALPVFLRVVRELPCTLAGKIDRRALRREEAARAIREYLRAAGISVNVLPDDDDPDAVRLVIDNIPRGRRPTVVRVMEQFAVPWRHAGEPPMGAAERGRQAVPSSN